MRVLIIDSDRVGLDFAMRASACGHEVKLFRYSAKPSRYATGFAPLFQIVDDWKQHMAWARDGLILLTANNRYVWDLDRYREMGFKSIFAPSVQSAKLEIERSSGMTAMQAIGQDIPPYQTFGSLAEAEAFARKSDRAWVHKPMGDEEDKSLTYVADDPADLVGWLQRQIKRGKKVKGKVMLQEKIDALCELGVSGWMGPGGFLPDKFQACVEHKKLHDGEIGPATGEQGTLTQYYEKDKLAEQMLLPLEPMLRALNHRGDFAIGAMIDTKGNPHFLEFTARCGYPCFWIQMASHRGDPVQWMKDLLDGKDTLKVSYDPAIGVVMSQPHYPYETASPDQVEGVPIRGVEKVMPDVHLVEVMKGTGPVMIKGQVADMPTFQTAGEYVCVATATGKTIEKARTKVYGIIDQIKFPDRVYRTDIGCKVQPKLSALHKFGYVPDLS